MNSPHSNGRVRINRAMLLVCDRAGRIQAVTSKAANETFPDERVAEKTFAEIFGAGSELDRWLADHIEEAQEVDQYSAEANLENDGDLVFVRIESLKRDGQPYGFALQLFPLVVAGTPVALRDGDSIVLRKQWHEIKNHVGALKLYATFLKKKMAEGDERRIVEKIFNGVNALIGYLDRIRKGAVQ
jgi:nitrogen-specific signal transduction histidine kinase